jgi:hypothetical protein
MSPVCQLEMTLPCGFPGVFGVTVPLMSDRELGRLEVLRDLDQKRLTTEAAVQLLGPERRQVFSIAEGRSESSAGSGATDRECTASEVGISGVISVATRSRKGCVILCRAGPSRWRGAGNCSRER